MPSATFDVVIAGAGPCGLMAAHELGRRGISVLLVDEDDTVATAPQANATQARTMEHYRRLGFASEIRALGMPSDHPTDIAYFTTYSGHELGRYKMPASQDADRIAREQAHIWNAAELPHRIPQSLVEHVLLDHARKLPSLDIRFKTRLTDFSQTADQVSCTISDLASGQSQEISASYLFAADGAQSGVRRALGIRYAGGEPAERDFMGGQMLSIYIEAPAFYDVLAGERAWMYWTFTHQRRALLATVDGKGSFALQTQLRPGETLEDITEEVARRLFLQAVGCDIPCQVKGMAQWVAGRALVAGRFRDGRILLGGDAVHIFTPTGGMGYNTAVEDAVNAGWKLAAVIKGEAGEALLESYEAERRPVALRNTEFAIRFADSVGLYRPSPAIEDEGEAGDAARARAGAYLARHASNEFHIPGFTFGARYDGSPAIVADNAPVPPDAPSVYVPSAKPGGRAPHAWLSDGASLFDRFGFEWTLLCFGEGGGVDDAFSTAAHRMGLILKILDLRNEPVAKDLYEMRFALIRPDQIVAWRGNGASASEAQDIFSQILSRDAPAGETSEQSGGSLQAEQ